MIDRVDHELLSWLKTLTDEEVSLSPPSSRCDRAVSVHLYEIVNDPPSRGTKRPPLQLILRYLITTHDPDIIRAHRLLGHIIVRCAERSQTHAWTLDFSPLPASIWSGIGAPPQPAFVVCVPLRHEWDQPELPRVTEPPELQSSPSLPLTGVVRGPRQIPVAGARLELRSLGLATVTNAAGEFRFASVPGGKHHPREVIVTAKGQRQTITLTNAFVGRPLIIDFEIAEI